MKRTAFTFASFLLVCLFLLHYFPFVQVRENSMSPTLEPGSLLVLNRLFYIFNEVRTGDVLVFPDIKGKMIIKRCVLVPGMRLQWQDKQLYISYWGRYVTVRPEVYQDLKHFDKVPPGQIFVLGDNMPHSVDSRKLGLVLIKNLWGKILWN